MSNQKSHTFEYPWTFCFKPRIAYKQQSERDWLSDYKTIFEIKDIENFWGVYNNVPCFTEMPHGSIYSFFRNNIHPSWEHPENIKGYSWIMYINKYTDREWVRKIYEYSLLTLIGSVYKYESILNGCTFEKKARGDKIVFWFKDEPTDGESHENILRELFDYLDVPQDEYIICNNAAKIDWKMHEYKKINAAVKLVYHDDNTNHKTAPKK
jgi:hypothetical protein